MRALLLSNMRPDRAHPERGRFVRDQATALRKMPGIELELLEFPPGASALLGAARELRRRAAERNGGTRGRPPRFDVVHAHFGLTAWPALAAPARVRAVTLHGTDVYHPRTRLATATVLPRFQLVAAVSASLLAELPWAGVRARAKVLPCGVDDERFRPMPRERARSELALDADGRYLLFPADPSRREKRHDLALELARAAGATLLTLGGVEPERVPTWLNAANAVVVPSDREGFGLAVLEALACDVPVVATPVGVHAEALAGVAGTLCAPFDVRLWSAALAPHLGSPEPRIDGRPAAARYSSRAMAELVLAAWQETLSRSALGGG